MKNMNKSRIFLANARIFSSADGYQVSSEDIQATTQLAQQLAQLKAEKDRISAETGCTKPFLNIGKKKKEYEECLSNSAKKKEDLLRRQEDLLRQQRELADRSRRDEQSEKKMFLFMPQEIGIPVTILASVALIFGAYKGIQYLKNKKQIIN